MSTLPFRLFRSLVANRSLLTISKKFTATVSNFKQSSPKITPKGPVNNKHLEISEKKSLNEKNIRAVAKLLIQYRNPESMKWGELIKQLNELKVRNHHLLILQACLRLRDTETGLSYYNYVTNTGQKLTAVELVFFIKLLGQSKDEFRKHENLVKAAYEEIKEYMNSSHLLQNYITTLIADIPSCYYDLIESNKEDLYNRRNLAVQAFKYKNAELGYNILGDKINCSVIFHSYIDYLCQMAVENKFTPDMITTFVKQCDEKHNIISSDSFIQTIQTLVNTLNHHDKEYVWTFHESHIDESSKCQCCGEKLIDKCISESDFNLLKESFLPTAGYTDRNVFLNSSDEELQRFYKFLNRCKPYDIVIDGLNVLYVTGNYLITNLSRYLKYFIDQGMSVLVVSRMHSRNQISRITFLRKKQYSDKCQFFFTQNQSDDDLFSIYAALHGGRKTYIVSGDFLNKYGARFSGRLKTIFFKWKLYHQILPERNICSLPVPHLGLSQLTVDKDREKYIWHLSYTPEVSGEIHLNPKAYIKWVCLQATKKSPELGE